MYRNFIRKFIWNSIEITFIRKFIGNHCLRSLFPCILQLRSKIDCIIFYHDISRIPIYINILSREFYFTSHKFLTNIDIFRKNCHKHSLRTK